jgi:Predicted hydrolases or acyltransferases (alpha/beta hydrolase superfamily)
MRLPVWLVSTSLILFSICSNGQDETERKQRPAETSVTVFGARLHYVDAGSGSVVVLLHGLADDVGVWGSVMPALAAKHRVIALDQIGFGRSDKPLLGYQAGTFVDFLDGFLNELKIDRASLVGNSFGGWIAADFALTHPERIDRLVLCDAAGYAAVPKTMDPRALNALRLVSREDIRYLGPLTFHNKRFYEDVDLAFKQRVTAGDGYTINQLLDSMIRGEDVLDGRLGAIHKPTLIVWGREDKLIPLNFAERFHKEITGSRLEVIDDCGHMPHVECADKFNHALLKFFGDEQ